jgi:hypothetical protein
MILLSRDAGRPGVFNITPQFDTSALCPLS